MLLDTSHVMLNARYPKISLLLRDKASGPEPEPLLVTSRSPDLSESWPNLNFGMPVCACGDVPLAAVASESESFKLPVSLNRCGQSLSGILSAYSGFTGKSYASRRLNIQVVLACGGDVTACVPVSEAGADSYSARFRDSDVA